MNRSFFSERRIRQEWKKKKRKRERNRAAVHDEINGRRVSALANSMKMDNTG